MSHLHQLLMLQSPRAGCHRVDRVWTGPHQCSGAHPQVPAWGDQPAPAQVPGKVPAPAWKQGQVRHHVKGRRGEKMPSERCEGAVIITRLLRCLLATGLPPQLLFLLFYIFVLPRPGHHLRYSVKRRKLMSRLIQLRRRSASTDHIHKHGIAYTICMLLGGMRLLW